MRRIPWRLLALTLIFAAAGCDSSTPNKPVTPSRSAVLSPTPTPTLTPTPTSPKPTSTPTTKPLPFFPQLFANGASSFASVTGAPAGSLCSAKAFIKSGGAIPGWDLKAKTVKDSSGATWDSKDGLPFKLPSPPPSPGQKAYWQAKCTNPAYEPSPPTNSNTFDIP